MKIRVDKDAIFSAIVGVFFGSMGIIGILLLSDSFSAVEIFLLVVFVMFILLSIAMLIMGISYYIIVEEGSVQLYRGKKLKKEILRTNIQRVLICQIMFHGKKNKYIVFDDGTFNKNKTEKKGLFSKKKRDTGGWIEIDYSNSRMDIVKQSFPECPIETLGPNEYSF